MTARVMLELDNLIARLEMRIEQMLIHLTHLDKTSPDAKRARSPALRHASRPPLVQEAAPGTRGRHRPDPARTEHAYLRGWKESFMQRQQQKQDRLIMIYLPRKR